MSAFANCFDRRLTWAVLASLALHLWAAAVFPSGTAARSRPAVISFARAAQIRIVRRSPPLPAPARIARPARVLAAPSQHHWERRAPSAPRAATRAARSLRAATPRIAAAMPSVAPAIVPPTSAAAPAPLRAHAAGGYMPFGTQEDDPVLDPRVLRTLRLLGAHATLTVLVGEDGKTKRVAFSPPLDPQIENEIENALADANWDPAYCGGGIPCAKSTIIKI